MRALLYADTFPRLARDIRQFPGTWLSRLLFLAGPWAAFWMVEILNENDIFSDLYPWQVLMNLVWYYLLFLLCPRDPSLGGQAGYHHRRCGGQNPSESLQPGDCAGCG